MEEKGDDGAYEGACEREKHSRVVQNRPAQLRYVLVEYEIQYLEVVDNVRVWEIDLV